MCMLIENIMLSLEIILNNYDQNSVIYILNPKSKNCLWYNFYIHKFLKESKICKHISLFLTFSGNNQFYMSR